MATARSTVIFDFDGTLVHTMPTVLSLINAIRVELNKVNIDAKDLMRVINIGGRELIMKALEIDESQSEKYIRLFRSRYMVNTLNLDTVYPGVHSVLSTLVEMNVPLLLCSNKPRILLEKSLEVHDLKKYFTLTIAGDDFGSRKPDALVFYEALECEMRPSDRILMVGDSDIDRAFAKNIGAEFYFFTGGYNCGKIPKKENSFSSFLNFDFNLI